MNLEAKPSTVLIAAMGGEGGGVLTDWLVSAAEAESLVVQSTSIPGVAQRTGATTYYVEMTLPPERSDRPPVLSLYPCPGDIDVMLASELVEAGRALQNGYVTPDRTTLVASTHRIYAVAERTAMADGRYDGSRVQRAADTLAQQAVMFDMARVAESAGSPINAVMLGALAGCGRLPIAVEAFEAAIRSSGKAVDSNLAGFRAGLAIAQGDALSEPAAASEQAPTARADALSARIAGDFPKVAHEILNQGVSRLIDYQDVAYAELYLARLDTVRTVEQGGGGDGALVGEAGRQLALWMSYEDAIRVAQLKSSAERIERVANEVGVKPGEPLFVTEFLKPGIEEFCSILPPALARTVIRWVDARGLRRRFEFGMKLRTSTVSGFLSLRTLAAMRRFRRRGYRFQQEQEAIEAWLGQIRAAAAIDLTLAREIADCARLLKGYSETYRRGRANFEAIMEVLVVPALAGALAPAETAAAIARARDAALADPEARDFTARIATIPEEGPTRQSA